MTIIFENNFIKVIFDDIFLINIPKKNEFPKNVENLNEYINFIKYFFKKFFEKKKKFGLIIDFTNFDLGNLKYLDNVKILYNELIDISKKNVLGCGIISNSSYIFDNFMNLLLMLNTCIVKIKMVENIEKGKEFILND